MRVRQLEQQLKDENRKHWFQKNRIESKNRKLEVENEKKLAYHNKIKAEKKDIENKLKHKQIVLLSYKVFFFFLIF
jgi:hypothetical protein